MPAANEEDSFRADALRGRKGESKEDAEEKKRKQRADDVLSHR